MSKPLVSVSTKTGDKGTTSLANGQRLSKTDSVFDVIGTVDELNSWLGLIAVKIEHSFPSERGLILEIQHQLFYLGAELALAPDVTLEKKALTTLEKHSEALQKTIADDWHRQFLLPGGTELGAFLDIARTVCRRSERLAVKYSDERIISPIILKYLNRLSDYLYVLRVFVNHAQQYPEQKFQKAKKGT